MTSHRSAPGGGTRADAPPVRLSGRSPAPEHLLLPGVRLFDPASGLDREGDLLVGDGRILSLAAGAAEAEGARRFDHLAGCTVFPGFVDVHTHLRTPGFEYKEDLASGGRAGAAGGFVALVNMANTDPVVDSGPVAGWVLDQAGLEAVVRIGQVGAVTRGQQGEELAELHELLDAGVAAFSDDGRPVADAAVLLLALRYLRGSGRAVMLHIEDRGLSRGGSMHEGAWSARLGLKGIPESAETAPLSQALDVLRYASAEAERQGADPVAVHVQHLSAAGSVALVAGAAGEGLPITAEATPHHLLLTDERVQTFDQNCKMNPPLRTEADRAALVAALADGTISCVATDHAPHAPHEKEVPFEEAPFGTLGLESAFPALYAGLVVRGSLPLERLISALTVGPSRVLGVDPPALEVGATADFCVVDLEERWRFSEADLQSKSRNSAFLGETVQGRIRLTVVGGGTAWELDDAPVSAGGPEANE